MKTVASLAVFVVLALNHGFVSAEDFDVEQFRANAASVVVDMSHHFELVQTLIALKIGDIPFGEHAAPILDEFFRTLPEYRKACHLGRADPNYSVTRFFNDLAENLTTIAAYYKDLQKKKDKSLEDERQCLSEHVIQFVANNMDIAKTALKFMRVVNKIRDEL